MGDTLSLFGRWAAFYLIVKSISSIYMDYLRRRSLFHRAKKSYSIWNASFNTSSYNFKADKTTMGPMTFIVVITIHRTGVWVKRAYLGVTESWETYYKSRGLWWLSNNGLCDSLVESVCGLYHVRWTSDEPHSAIKQGISGKNGDWCFYMWTRFSG